MKRVGRSRVSAMTQTPASGPRAPETTPPISSLSIVTAGFAPPWPEIAITSDDNKMPTTAAVARRTLKRFDVIVPLLDRRAKDTSTPNVELPIPTCQPPTAKTRPGGWELAVG